ncbi:MAG: hypothetical protein AB2L21_03145 [Anaerolineaceae bacterium]
MENLKGGALYLQKGFYQLAKEAVIKPRVRARRRMRLLTTWEALHKQKMNGKWACEVVVEVSQTTQEAEGAGLRGLTEPI